MTRILIVDDHPLVRMGFSHVIADEADLEVCGEAADMAKALQLVASEKPDLVIVDLSLAGGNGLDLIEHIKAHNTKVCVLVASMHDESLFAERALNAGALGYINKQEAQDKIIHAIRRVLKGKVYLSERMTERMLNNLVNNDQGRGHTGIEQLSNRELGIFELIGQGLTTTKIAEHLNLSIKTIETHQANIKKKLGLISAHELVHRAVHWLMDRT